MDLIACVLEVIGAWLVGNRNKWCFPMLIAGNCFWLVAGVNKEMIGLIIVSIIFVGINVRNCVKWRRKEE